MGHKDWKKMRDFGIGYQVVRSLCPYKNTDTIGLEWLKADTLSPRNKLALLTSMPFIAHQFTPLGFWCLIFV